MEGSLPISNFDIAELVPSEKLVARQHAGLSHGGQKSYFDEPMAALEEAEIYYFG